MAVEAAEEAEAEEEASTEVIKVLLLTSSVGFFSISLLYTYFICKFLFRSWCLYSSLRK